MLNKRADKLELLRIAEAVALEKSIDKELIISSMEIGIAKAAKSKFGQDNEIKVKPIMYLALSYDHRIIDGKDSVSFLKTVKENLEDPRRLFLNI